MREDEQPVEVHVVSDATGETATRVVAAVEAQFPDQAFVTVRHPRAETVADLQLALARMEGAPAVVIYTLVEPTLRAAMRELCIEAGVDSCDLLAQPLSRGREGLGSPGRDAAARAPATRRDLLQADRRDRVRGQERRRPRAVARQCGRRARRRLANLEDAAFDLPRLPRLEGDERPAREGDRAAAGALRDRSRPHRRADDRRAASGRDPQRADRPDGRRPELRRPERDLRGSRACRGDPASGSAAP